MLVPRITNSQSNSFGGYKSLLKDLYKNDLLPTVKIGLYGGKLSKNNVSYEHIKPYSQNGLTTLMNGALATCENNKLRGNDDIRNHLTPQMLYNYLIQFKDIVVQYRKKVFIGNDYILGVLNTLHKLNFAIPVYH